MPLHLSSRPMGVIGHVGDLLDGFVLTVLIIALGTTSHAIRVVKELRRSIRR